MVIPVAQLKQAGIHTGQQQHRKILDGEDHCNDNAKGIISYSLEHFAKNVRKIEKYKMTNDWPPQFGWQLKASEDELGSFQNSNCVYDLAKLKPLGYPVAAIIQERKTQKTEL